MNGEEKPGNLPHVSVIMPVRNEADFIARSLGAVLAQDYPPERMQVLIADGMSSDATRATIAQTVVQHPGVDVRVLDNPGQIVPSGLNAALDEAKGTIIVRVDGHTLIAPDYVRECVAALARSGADNVGGRMDAVGQGRMGEAVALATSSPFGVGGARFHYSQDEEWVDTVYMGAWRREIFDKERFDEELVRNQDDEFNYRIGSNGGRILLSPRIKSRYHNRSSLPALWRQYYQYGHYKVRVMQKHPAQMRPRQFAPPAFVAALLGSALMAMFFPVGRLLLALVAASYGLANLGASLWIARRAGWRHLPLLPVTFLTLHVGYGLGFLAGLVRFAGKWGT